MNRWQCTECDAAPVDDFRDHFALTGHRRHTVIQGAGADARTACAPQEITGLAAALARAASTLTGYPYDAAHFTVAAEGIHRTMQTTFPAGRYDVTVVARWATLEDGTHGVRISSRAVAA